MRLWIVWLAVAAVMAAGGCRQEALRGRPTPANQPVAAPAPEPRPEPTKPAVPPKEMVVAWEISLLYLLEDGKPIGPPLVLNSAERQYFREAHLGEFEITEKIREWRSNLYDVHGDPLPDRSMAETQGAVMRNWMRIGDSAVGFHYSPAFRFFKDPRLRHRSHGCYRLNKEESNRLFAWAPVGTPVHVVRSLAGTKWAFLRAHTPPELLPGHQLKKRKAPAGKAGASSKRR